VVDVTLPAVVTVQTRMNTPATRPQGHCGEEEKPVATLALSICGSTQRRIKLRTVSRRSAEGEGREILTGSPDEVAKALVSRIRGDGSPLMSKVFAWRSTTEGI
jgi:electron transfer flavoprotein alpha/beta subunit